MFGKKQLAGFACGILFGLGLGISRAALPSTVQGFLDFFGAWDATLGVFFAAGAIAYALFHRVARGTLRPVFAEAFVWPKRQEINRRTILGATLFGAGWGLSGVCPGPGVEMALWSPAIFTFTVSLVAGIFGFELLGTSRLAEKTPNPTQA